MEKISPTPTNYLGMQQVSKVLTVNPVSTGRQSVTVNIGKVCTHALLDSGSEVTLILGSFFTQIKNNPNDSVVRENRLELFTAYGSSLQNQGEVERVFKIKTKNFKSKFVVVPK